MQTIDFIFMLTRQDRTVADAMQHVSTALAAGVLDIGFKDVGLPLPALEQLHREIRRQGGRSYLEVVSLDLDSELQSAAAAVRLGVDYLLGGTHVEQVLPLLAGSGIRYFPFAGRVRGHPGVLEGSMREIAASAGEIASHPGVDGLDLLAYRSSVQVPELVAAVCEAARKPVIAAGSIRTPAQIRAVRDGGASAFTVGTAALDGAFPASGAGLAGQLAAILEAREQG